MGKTAKETAIKILDKDFVGTMATVRENKPHSRYMTFYNDDLTLYTATSRDTHKVEDLQENPNTHILIGYEGKGFGDVYLEIEGTVAESEEESVKEKVLKRVMDSLSKKVDESSLIILKITPTHIRLMNKKGEPPEMVDLHE